MRLLRLKDIIGDRKNGIAPLIPVSAATWWRGVANGRFPQGELISTRVRAWREEDVRAIGGGK